jgi:hypothetical protein
MQTKLMSAKKTLNFYILLSLFPRTLNTEFPSQVWWLITIIPAIQEVEIRRTEVQSQPRQKVSKTPYKQKGWPGGTHL